MRGTSLIFHSFDPETLERASDLESLNPDSLDDERGDRYSELDLRLQPDTLPNRNNHIGNAELIITNSNKTKLVTTNLNKCQIGHHQNESSTKIGISGPLQTQTYLSQSHDFNCSQNNSQEKSRNNNNKDEEFQAPPHRISTSTTLNLLSSSPPLMKSHYDSSHETNPKSQSSASAQGKNDIKRYFHNPSDNRQYFVNDDDKTESRSQQNLLQQQMKEKTLTPLGSGMPLSRLRHSQHHHYNTHQSIDKGTLAEDYYSANNAMNQNHNPKQGGFSRFLFNFDFKHKKEDKSKLDIYNLPPQLKAELKQIYVF